MGYVGAGSLAQMVHIPNIALMPDVEFAALCEVREKLGRAVCRKYDIPKYYRDHRELARDEKIEAVGVSGHFAVQGDIAADLLAAGKSVFMEKPMAVSVKQAEKILDAERKGGGRLMVGYMKRYDGGNLLVKEAIERFAVSGEMGKITYIRNHGYCGDWIGGLDVSIIKTDEPYPAVPALNIDWLSEQYHGMYIGYLQQYTHNVNLIRFFAGAEKADVKVVDLNPDGFTGIVIFEVNGIRAIIESGSDAYHGWDEHTQVYFEKGWIKTCVPVLLLKNVPASVEIYQGGSVRTLTTSFAPFAWSYKKEIEHFAARVRDGKPFDSSGQDTLNDVKFFEDVYKKFIAGGRP